MRVANLIEPWKGDQSNVSVYEFFEAIDEEPVTGDLCDLQWRWERREDCKTGRVSDASQSLMLF
jgi:hypothetical protein